jgi:anti-sigma factor RsiW
MTCEQFRERLTAFSLGELEPNEVDAAREHVTHCSACASSALLDRQLTALVRASAVPAPAEVRAEIMAALRREAAQAEPVGSGATRERAVRGQRRRGRGQRRRGRGRHWLALGAAAGLAGALLAATVLIVPAPQRSSALAAAWSAYRSESVMLRQDATTQKRLAAVLGPAAQTPDLGSLGLHVRAAGSRMLADHLAAVTEYRDAAGRRVTLIRWKGSLPEMPGASGEPQEGQLEAARWDRTGSIWWHAHGIVYCLIGGVDQHTLYEVTEKLQSLEDW